MSCATYESHWQYSSAAIHRFLSGLAFATDETDRLQLDIIGIETVDSHHPALKLRHTLRGHTHNVHRMALSPDGQILASPSGIGLSGFGRWQAGGYCKALNIKKRLSAWAGRRRVRLWRRVMTIQIKCVSGMPRLAIRFGFWKSMTT